ncbi:hypothetical protein VS868_12080 [Salinimicrobium sp. 3283s]|uniref:hypothetical protein n=1 Tax=Salinimicrobium sp. 3283s TaxID=3114359 RepID=UPI0031E7B786
MSRSVVPVHITPHLVPFFFEEFEGIEAMYLNKRVKAAKISTKKPLGRMIRLLIEHSPSPVKPEKFHMYLSVQDREQSKNFFGQFYKCESGKNTWLRLPEVAVQLINDHLEETFRTSMMYFVLGHITENDSGQIRKAVDLFLIKYDLYEHGFENESMRRYYYRVMKEGYLLKKMQHEGQVKHKKKERKKPDPEKIHTISAGQISLF